MASPVWTPTNVIDTLVEAENRLLELVENSDTPKEIRPRIVAIKDDLTTLIDERTGDSE